MEEGLLHTFIKSRRTPRKNSHQFFIKLLCVKKVSAEIESVSKLSRLIYKIRRAWGEDKKVNQIKESAAQQFITYRKNEKASSVEIKEDLRLLATVMDTCIYNPQNPFNEALHTVGPGLHNKEIMTISEIKRMEKQTLYGENELARDIFLFSYYACGMKFYDVGNLHR